MQTEASVQLIIPESPSLSVITVIRTGLMPEMSMKLSCAWEKLRVLICLSEVFLHGWQNWIRQNGMILGAMNHIISYILLCKNGLRKATMMLPRKQSRRKRMPKTRFLMQTRDLQAMRRPRPEIYLPALTWGNPAEQESLRLPG